MPCLQTCKRRNRYEHSLDSAIHPVRPGGISRRTREHPCGAHPGRVSLSRALFREPLLREPLLRDCAPRRPGAHDHCGVSVRTSSETESVARRSPDLREEIDPTRKHTC
jgi:hypothetical protein